MAVTDSIDTLKDFAEGGVKWVIEMKPYLLQWTPSFFSWNGREVSVLLPSGTQYSKGLITQTDKNGFYPVSFLTRFVWLLEHRIEELPYEWRKFFSI